MKNDRQMGTLLLSAIVLISLMVSMSNVLPEGENSGLAGAEFLVS